MSVAGNSISEFFKRKTVSWYEGIKAEKRFWRRCCHLRERKGGRRSAVDFLSRRTQSALQYKFDGLGGNPHFRVC